MLCNTTYYMMLVSLIHLIYDYTFLKVYCLISTISIHMYRNMCFMYVNINETLTCFQDLIIFTLFWYYHTYYQSMRLYLYSTFHTTHVAHSASHNKTTTPPPSPNPPSQHLHPVINKALQTVQSEEAPPQHLAVRRQQLKNTLN